MLLLALAFASLSAWASGLSLSQPFDALKEFPNYFLPKEYRGRQTSDIPADVIKKQRELLDQALGSVFERLVVPIVPEGEKGIRQVRYFPYLRERLLRVDPGMKLYASGGVVRTALSYVYDEVFQALEMDPKKDAAQVLKKIAESKEDLPAIRVRGVGSDFDMLVQSSNGQTHQLQALATQITNSASEASGAKLSNYSVQNAFFTLGDVRDYNSQIERSTRQGGSVVDYLAFELGTKTLKEPPRFPGLVERIVSGHYEFAPPAQGAAPEDLGDSVIRGARTLLELPWLKLENEKYYREQVQALNESLSKGQALSKRAMGQFAKGIRNSRYFGAHNRFYRANSDTAEADILKLASRLANGNVSTLLPEFADARKIEIRSGDRSELNGLPKELLTPVSEFKAKYTDKGVLHHGTPSIENALAIMRQGLFLSKNGQGTALYGRGVYSSPDRKISEGYAGDKGIIFDLQIKDDPRLNILNWEKVANHPAIQKIKREAGKQGRDVFEYLSREHGIDIIKNHHVLIQNSDAVALPGGLKAIAQSIAYELVHDKKVNLDNFMQILPLNDYLERIGESSPLDQGQWQKVYASLTDEIVTKSGGSKSFKAFSNDSAVTFVRDVILTGKFTPDQSTLVSLAKAFLEGDKESYFYKGTELGVDLIRLIHDGADREHLIVTALSAAKSTVQARALSLIDWGTPQAQKYDQALGQALLRGDANGFLDKLSAAYKRPPDSQKKIYDSAIQSALQSIRKDKKYVPSRDLALVGFVRHVILSKKYVANQSEIAAFAYAFLEGDKEYYHIEGNELGAQLIPLIEDKDVRADLLQRAFSSKKHRLQSAALEMIDWSSPQVREYDQVLGKTLLLGDSESQSEKLKAAFLRPAESQNKIFEVANQNALRQIRENKEYVAPQDAALVNFAKKVILSKKLIPRQSDLVTLAHVFLDGDKEYYFNEGTGLGARLIPLIENQAERERLMERALSSKKPQLQQAALETVNWGAPQAQEYDQVLGKTLLLGDGDGPSEKLKATLQRPAQSQQKIFEIATQNALREIRENKKYAAYEDVALVQFTKQVILSKKLIPRQSDLVTLARAFLDGDKEHYFKEGTGLGARLIPLIEDKNVREELLERSLSSRKYDLQKAALEKVDWSSPQAREYDQVLGKTLLLGHSESQSEKLKATLQRPAQSQQKIFEIATQNALREIRENKKYSAHEDAALVQFTKNVILSKTQVPRQSDLVTLAHAFLDGDKEHYFKEGTGLGARLIPLIEDQAERESLLERALSSEKPQLQQAALEQVDWSSPQAREYDRTLVKNLFAGGNWDVEAKVRLIKKQPADVQPALFKEAFEASLNNPNTNESMARVFLGELQKAGIFQPDSKLLEAIMAKHLRPGDRDSAREKALQDLKEAVNRGDAWAISAAKSYVSDSGVPRLERNRVAKMLPSLNLKADHCVIMYMKRLFGKQ
ncbi:MAG: hypothetical protein ACJ763_02525 [Bdellovibrionia bacterium]